MKQVSPKKKILLDLALIAGLLLISGILLLFLRDNREEGGVAVVRVEGKTVAEYPLSRSGEYELNGGTNILVIEDGYAWLREANCPDKLCVKQGRIHYTGEVITCLPNKLTVTIEGGESNGVDLVVG
jgi:hypothetical protein